MLSTRISCDDLEETEWSHWIDRKMTICNSYQGHYFNSSRAAAQIKRALKDFVCVRLLAARAAAWLCADPACSLILSLFSSPPLPAPGCNSGIDGTASLREARPSSALLTSAPLPPWPPTHLLSPHLAFTTCTFPVSPATTHTLHLCPKCPVGPFRWQLSPPALPERERRKPQTFKQRGLFLRKLPEAFLQTGTCCLSTGLQHYSCHAAAHLVLQIASYLLSWW